MRRCALSRCLIDDTNEECRSGIFGAALFVGDRHNFVTAGINKLIRTAPSGRAIITDAVSGDPIHVSRHARAGRAS
jgi:hypothetical protein